VLTERDDVMNNDNKEKLSKLYQLRRTTIDSINEYKKEISVLNETLDDINNNICKIKGHSFSCREKNGVYIKKCRLCGKIIVTNYKEDNVNKKKIKVKVK